MKTPAQLLRSLVIDLTIRGMNFLDERVIWPAIADLDWDDDDDDETPSPLMARIGYKLNDALSWAFGLAWNGSDEEIEMALRDEMPLDAMSDRQLAAVQPHFASEVHCVHCLFDGYLHECDEFLCPDCGEGVWMGPLGFTPTTPEPLLLMERSAL